MNSRTNKTNDSGMCLGDILKMALDADAQHVKNPESFNPYDYTFSHIGATFHLICLASYSNDRIATIKAVRQMHPGMTLVHARDLTFANDYSDFYAIFDNPKYRDVTEKKPAPYVNKFANKT